MRLLVTRPAPDAARTSAALRACGHDVLTAPMLHMTRLVHLVPDEAYGGVVVTSANAARAISGDLRWKGFLGLPVYTVGRHTEEAARNAGFVDVRCAEASRFDLVNVLLSQQSLVGPLLHLAGEDRAGDFEHSMSHPRIDVVVVYRMIKRERFEATVDSALAEARIDGVLHYSRRSAQAYIECATRTGLLEAALAPLHFCLSRQVAEPLLAQQLGGRASGEVKIAAHPNEAALLDLVNAGAVTCCDEAAGMQRAGQSDKGLQ
jgi:uroporphyrinogen-III synthase